MKYDMLPEGAFQKLGRRMILCGGGSGSSGPSTTTVNNSNLPDYLQGQATQVSNLGVAAMNSPYQGYQDSGNQVQLFNGQMSGPGQQIAGFTGAQTAAQNATTNMQSQDPAYNYAQGANAGVINNTWNANTAQNYMNPYMNSVTNNANQLLAHQYALNQNQQDSQFATAGAFGGSRQAVTDSQNQQNLLLAQQQNIDTNLFNAYSTGQQQFNTQNQTQLNAANQLASTAGQQQATNLNLVGAQNAVGSAQQAQNQQLLNQAGQNFTNQQNWNMNQAQAASAVLHGTPYSMNQTAQTYQAAPNATGQITGLGIAGVGAYNAANATK